MSSFPPLVQKLVREFSKLPSIGEKSATRLAYHLVSNDRNLALSLADALRSAAMGVVWCRECFNMSDAELCSVCRNPARDRQIICIVEKPMDVAAIERVGEFRGLYHVLHGLWAPLKGQGPEKMRLKELEARLTRTGDEQVRELILATSATVEGDATALYVAKIAAAAGVKSSRLAQGMPKGGELEYADDVTLSRAFSGRNVLGG